MRSLRQRLTAGLIAVFALLLAAGGLLLYGAARDSLTGQFDAALRLRALVVITDIEEEEGRLRVRFSDDFLREFGDRVATSFFQVWDRTGTIVGRSDSLNQRHLPFRYGTLEEPAFFYTLLPTGHPGRAIGVRFTPESDADSPLQAIVVVASDRRALDATLEKLGYALAISGLALLGSTALAVPLVLRPALRPLDRLAAQASEIHAASLGSRLPTAGLPAELTPIVGRFNDLLGRLERSFERERRFSSDLAHELLTPLAELRMLTECALKWPEEAGEETHRKSLQTLLRMEALVTRMLELSRAEDGRAPLPLEPIALRPFLEEVWRPLREPAAARRFSAAFDVPESAVLLADPTLLRSLFSNLLGNAVDHSPEGGRLEVRHRETGETFSLMFSNTCEGLEPADLPRLFERFWRKDSSRTGTRHRGLGLSLSREFARLLGWRLEAALPEPRLFSLELTGRREPAAAAETKSGERGASLASV